MTKTTVVNKKHGVPFDVDISRAGKWGNPFSHLDHSRAPYKVATLEESVARHKEWLPTQPHLMAALYELKGKVLGCHCKPHACHGDFLAELANALPEVTADATSAGKNVIHISLTGHRPDKLAGYDMRHPAYKDLQNDLELYIEKNLAVWDQVVGHSGLALGADTVWSKAILAMKDKYPGRVLFHAEIPMMEQAEAWFKKSDIEFWHEQVSRADFKDVYGSLAGKSDAERKRLAGKFLNVRNEGMLNHADVLLALHDGSSGGTNNAVTYGQKIGLVTHTVHPDVYFKK